MLDLEIKKYDLEENKAAQLQALYMPMLDMLTSFEAEFNTLVKKDITSELEAERLFILQDYEPLTVGDGRLGAMDLDVWNNYINGVKLNFQQVQAANEKAELERIAAEKAEQKRIADIEKENKRLAKEKSELEKIQAAKDFKAEKERKRLADLQAKKDAKQLAETNRLKAEQQKELERLAKIQSEKLAKEKADKQKLADELEGKRVAEIKAKQKIESDLQAELNKGDTEKVKDLITDFKIIKEKYTFKSEKNRQMYIDVSNLIDKVINHINK